jgi:cation-transporting ATPase 13A1
MILSLQSLISAYSMSVLNFEALKFSETQMTILGITGAANYYYFSNGKIVKEIPDVR